MCDFCDNKNPYLEVGFVAPINDCNSLDKKWYCRICGDDENSKLYDFIVAHPDWDFNIC